MTSEEVALWTLVATTAVALIKSSFGKGVKVDNGAKQIKPSDAMEFYMLQAEIKRVSVDTNEVIHEYVSNRNGTDQKTVMALEGISRKMSLLIRKVSKQGDTEEDDELKGDR